MTPSPAKRRTAPEIIGFHLGWDIGDVSYNRYQPTRYSSPAIYTCGDYYFAAPSDNRPPKRPEMSWEPVGEYYGRRVYRASPNSPELTSEAQPSQLRGIDGHPYTPLFGQDGASCECSRAKERHK